MPRKSIAKPKPAARPGQHPLLCTWEETNVRCGARRRRGTVDTCGLQPGDVHNVRCQVAKIYAYLRESLRQTKPNVETLKSRLFFVVVLHHPIPLPCTCKSKEQSVAIVMKIHEGMGMDLTSSLASRLSYRLFSKHIVKKPAPKGYRLGSSEQPDDGTWIGNDAQTKSGAEAQTKSGAEAQRRTQTAIYSKTCSQTNGPR